MSIIYQKVNFQYSLQKKICEQFNLKSNKVVKFRVLRVEIEIRDSQI